MDRFVVMVDAGYFLRQSIEIVSGCASKERKELGITAPDVMIDELVKKCRSVLGIPNRELLRVYWYDGVMSTGLTTQQKSIVSLPDVLFRAGTINSHGQQKGVDSLIVTDLIELASNHSICDAALVTGDSDLAVGIEISQMKGVRIAVIGLEDLSVGVSHKQSFEITSRADRIGRWGGSDLAPFMRYNPPTSVVHVTPVASSVSTVSVAPSAISSASSPLTDEEKIKSEVKSFIASQANPKDSIDPSTKSIDGTIDKQLLYHVYSGLGRKLTGGEKIVMRDFYKKELGF